MRSTWISLPLWAEGKKRVLTTLRRGCGGKNSYAYIELKDFKDEKIKIIEIDLYKAHAFYNDSNAKYLCEPGEIVRIKTNVQDAKHVSIRALKKPGSRSGYNIVCDGFFKLSDLRTQKYFISERHKKGINLKFADTKLKDAYIQQREKPL